MSLTVFLFSISCLLTAIGSIVLGFFTYFKGKKTPVNISWAILTVAIFIWEMGYYFLLIADNNSLALISVRFLYFGASFIPALWLRFIITFLNIFRKRSVYLMYKFALYMAFIFCGFSFTKLFVADVKTHPPFEFYTVPGIVHHIFVIFFVFYFFYCLILKIQYFNKVTYYKQNQLKYILIAFLVGFIGGGTNYPFIYNLIDFPYGHPLVMLYAVIITYAVAKHRLMDIRVAVTRAGIFAVVYSMVLGIPFIIGSQTKSWLIPTGIMFFLATAGPIIYTRLRKRAENVILAQQKRYQRTLFQAAQGMVKIKDLKHLVNLIVHIITRAVKVNMAAIFLLDAEKKVYRAGAVRDHDYFKKDAAIPVDDALIKHISRTQEPLLLEDISAQINSISARRHIRDVFNKYQIQLIVPSFTERKLLGFLVLGPKTNRQVFTQDDINVFKILANQAALAVENCNFLEESQKSQEKIFRADKLATVGAMAEGVAHQLNNRLQAFAALAGDLKDVVEEALKRNPEKQIHDDLEYCHSGLDKVEQNVMHSAQIIRGILNYARTEKETSFRMLDIREILTIAVDLLGVKHKLKDFKPQVNIPEDVPEVYASPAQLSEALFNLIDNAFEAIEDRENRLKVEGKAAEIKKEIVIGVKPLPASLLVKVTDNGIGIKKADEPKMFAPFYTTKSSAKSGTGLGMYVVNRIIEDNHKGKIWFESAYMKGTTFYIELPCKKK